MTTLGLRKVDFGEKESEPPAMQPFVIKSIAMQTPQVQKDLNDPPLVTLRKISTQIALQYTSHPHFKMVHKKHDCLLQGSRPLAG